VVSCFRRLYLGIFLWNNSVLSGLTIFRYISFFRILIFMSLLKTKTSQWQKEEHKWLDLFLQMSLEPFKWSLTFVKFLNYSEVLHSLSRYYDTSARTRDSAVGIAINYGLDDRGIGVIVPVGSRIFSSPSRPDWRWVHPTSYPIGTGGSFPGGEVAWTWSWHLVPRSRKCGYICLLRHTPWWRSA
jgi:hypothetical protein